MTTDPSCATNKYCQRGLPPTPHRHHHAVEASTCRPAARGRRGRRAARLVAGPSAPGRARLEERGDVRRYARLTLIASALFVAISPHLSCSPTAGDPGHRPGARRWLRHTGGPARWGGWTGSTRSAVAGLCWGLAAGRRNGNGCRPAVHAPCLSGPLYEEGPAVKTRVW